MPRHGFVDGGDLAVRVGHHAGQTAVGLHPNRHAQRQGAQVGHAFGLRHFFAAFDAKDVLGVAALAAHMHRHVFHDAQDGHTHLLEHADALHRVQQGNVLRRGDDHRTGQRYALAQGELDVAGAGGHVDDQVIKVAPIGLAQQLLQGLRGHRAAPHHGLVLRHQKANRHDLHAVVFQRLHGFAVGALGPTRQAHHHRLAGAVNVRIQQTHTGTFRGQGQRQIGSGRAFANAAFARGHRNDVFHLRQQSHARLRGVGNDLAADRCLDRSDTGHSRHHLMKLLLKGRPKALGGVTQHQVERHRTAVDAQVFHGFAADEVLASEWVHHGLQRVGDVLFAQGHVYSSVSIGEKGTSLAKQVRPHARQG